MFSVADRIRSSFRKPRGPADGQTLAFLAAALERVIITEHREMLLGKAREVERRICEVDHVLTACDRCSAMDGLAEKIDAVHVSIADLLSSLADPNGAVSTQTDVLE